MAGGGVDAADSFQGWRCQGLVGYRVVEAVSARFGGFEGFVSYADVALGFPHGQGGVGYVPGAGQPLRTRGDEAGVFGGLGGCICRYCGAGGC